MSKQKLRIRKTLCDEKFYEEICSRHLTEVFSASARSAEEGFSELEREGSSASMAGLMRSVPVRQLMRMMWVMARWMPFVSKGRKQSYNAVFDYLKELENNGSISQSNKLVETFPNNDVW